MNRRGFLAGLLATSTSVAVAKALPEEPKKFLQPRVKTRLTPSIGFGHDPDTGMGKLDNPYLEFTHDGSDLVLKTSNCSSELRFVADA